MAAKSAEALARKHMKYAIKVLRQSALTREFTLPFNEALEHAERCMSWLEEEKYHSKSYLARA